MIERSQSKILRSEEENRRIVGIAALTAHPKIESSSIYEQQQTPPQQRSLQEGSYQQQSYRPGAIFSVSFFAAFLSLFFILSSVNLM